MPEASLAPSRPARRPLVLALAFAGWTAYVWTTRIRNAVADDALSGGAKGVTMVTSAAFVAGSIALGWLAWRSWRRSGAVDGVAGAVLTALLAATVLVWAIRVPVILADSDRSIAFKVVHASLALISVALGVAARRRAEASGQPVRPVLSSSPR